jgi:hypothetical protein
MTRPTSSPPARPATSPSETPPPAPPTPRPVHGQPGKYGTAVWLHAEHGAVVPAMACQLCGALVVETAEHDAFHVRIGY